MSIHIKKAMKIMALIVTYGGEGGFELGLNVNW
jgi:hypothetical protein